MTQQLFDLRTRDEKFFDFFLDRNIWVTAGHEEEVRREYKELWEQFLNELKQSENV